MTHTREESEHCYEPEASATGGRVVGSPGLEQLQTGWPGLERTRETPDSSTRKNLSFVICHLSSGKRYYEPEASATGKRTFINWLFCLTLSITLPCLIAWTQTPAQAAEDPATIRAVSRALEFLSRDQRRQGYWEATQGQFRVAMTALSGMALLAEGSTTTRGKYARNISRAVDFILDAAQPNGLIGYPDDVHYTYGHGFSMLFLSQVFGEEEDEARRKQIKQVLEKAVKFSIEAQTTKGGWGYVSARDGNDFDEGSTCVTQVQGLRACRNAGIVVPREVIDRAKKYIHDCLSSDGGVQYSIRGGGARAPITAAAVASMFSAGDYGDSDDVKRMLQYCKTNIWPEGQSIKSNGFGHWHYLHFYYAQVMYRDTALWEKYIGELRQVLIAQQSTDGSWQDNMYGPVYVTAINAIVLQLDKGYLPIYQR